VLDQILADLEIEGDLLWNAVAVLDDSPNGGWQTPTPAVGWSVATQIAHLLWTDEVAVSAATDKEAWDAVVRRAIEDPSGYIDGQALEVARLAPEAMLARWGKARAALAAALRDYPAGEKLPWFGPPMSPTSMATARFMETWAHGLDVYDALGIRPEVTDRIRHVAHLGVRTRDYAYSVHGLEPPKEDFFVELTAPSGALWTWGPDVADQGVHGSSDDFCRLVTQRLHRDDTDLVATGADAEHWLTIAQAFAGPPGEGRRPRG
jgi:uncharacterized protein (TIGR03084 family)